METGEKVIVLDAEKMTDGESLHSYLRERMSLPDYYGNNFDALYDVLTEIGEFTRIRLKNSGCLEELGWFGRQLLRVFREAAEDNCYLSIQEPAAGNCASDPSGAADGGPDGCVGEILTEEGEEE